MAEQDIQIPDEEDMTPELSQEIAGLTGTDRAALLALLMAETQAAVADFCASFITFYEFYVFKFIKKIYA